tara:strand:+ start:6797 stop:7306 length:510 start_codon:yes stop_codon:yes gene_type:complete
MISNSIGIGHLIASILALIAGSSVLKNPKGTKTHKQIGYIYTVAMSIVLISSFMIYRLHGTFGILHWFAVISSITLLAGIVPMFFKKPSNFINFHYSFMYWSVIGLYCAFFAEVLTRIPFILEVEDNIAVIFYAMVGVATAIVASIGSFYFRRFKKKWNVFTVDIEENS